jgi:predicted dehydrogenase
VLAHGEVLTPAKPDLGAVNLGEAIDWGGGHAVDEASAVRKGTAFDYASLAVQMENGAVGTFVLSHAPFLRKGVAPELELHGTQASLSICRISGDVRLFLPNAEPQTLTSTPDEGLGNRFKKFAFPGLRDRIAGRASEHPGLEDGYRIQLFTDAAAISAREGRWVGLSELDKADSGETLPPS